MFIKKPFNNCYLFCCKEKHFTCCLPQVARICKTCKGSHKAHLFRGFSTYPTIPNDSTNTFSMLFIFSQKSA